MEAKNQGNFISRIIIGCLISALGFALINLLMDRVFSLTTAQIPSWQSGLWYYLMGLIMIIVFIPVLLKTPWRGFTLLMGIWLPLLFIFYISAYLIEGYFFSSIPPSELLFGSLQGIAATLVLAYLMISIFPGKGEKAVSEEKRALPLKRAWYSWVWRILVCALIYLILYLVVGGIFYVNFFKPYYEDPSYALTPPETSPEFFKWLIPLQIFRGALYALVLLPLCLSLNMSRIHLALLLGALLYLLGGFAPLIMPNPYMPDKLRFYHGIEIFFQNFPPGIAIAYLLAPKRKA